MGLNICAWTKPAVTMSNCSPLSGFHNITILCELSQSVLLMKVGSLLIGTESFLNPAL